MCMHIIFRDLFYSGVINAWHMLLFGGYVCHRKGSKILFIFFKVSIDSSVNRHFNVPHK